MEVKICNRCHKEKPITEFHKNRSTKDGLCGMCKDCNKAHSKAWRDKNIERAREYDKRYSAEHREEAVERTRKWRAENKERRNECSRLQWSNGEIHREKVRIRKRDWRYCKRHGMLFDGCEIHRYYYVADNEMNNFRLTSYTVMTHDEHVEWHRSRPDWVDAIVKGDDLAWPM